MIKKLFLLVMPLILLALLIGCAEPGKNSTILVKEKQKTYNQDPNDINSLLNVVKNMGFDTSNYFISDEKIVVEGDIALNIEMLKKEVPSQNNSSGQLKQYAHIYTVSPIRSSNVRVYIPSGLKLTRWDWSGAAENAFNDWNNIGYNSLVHFTEVGDGEPYDLLIDLTHASKTFIIQSDLPVDTDNPGRSMLINLDADQLNLSSSQKERLMVHELGHTIGLRHVNVSESDRIQIPNSPTSDSSSVMYPNPNSIPSWSGFSWGDILAISYLFGDNYDPYAIVYSNANYTGKRWIIRPEWDVPDLNTVSLNKSIRSIQFFHGGMVCLFNSTNYLNSCATITSSIPDLSVYGCSNWASSILWNSGTPFIVLYEHDNYGGKTKVIRGNVTALSSLSFNDMASSIRFFNGARVTLYEHDNYNNNHSGKTLSLSSDTPLLKNYKFNDMTSSIAFY